MSEQHGASLDDSHGLRWLSAVIQHSTGQYKMTNTRHLGNPDDTVGWVLCKYGFGTKVRAFVFPNLPRSVSLCVALHVCLV